MKRCDAAEVPDSTQCKQTHRQHSYGYPPIIAQTPTLIPQSPVPIPQSPALIPQSPVPILQRPILVSQDCPFIPGPYNSHSPGHFNFSQPLPPVTMSHQSQMNDHTFVFSSPPISSVNELFPILSGIDPNHDGFSSPNTQTLQDSLCSPHPTANGSSQISPAQYVPSLSSSPTSTLRLHHYPFESPCHNNVVPDLNGGGDVPVSDSPGFQVC